MADQVRIDLSPLMREINAVGSQLSSQISQVDHRVFGVASDVSTTRSELAQLRADFDGFVQAQERAKLVQLAETRLGTLKADLEREYGHYAVVRRTSIGILQAFDIGNVRNKTVHEVSEELMIQTPKYWLAPALVALAAWSKDDRDLAEKSVDAAFSRDPKKTSLFFALTLRRQGRLAEATRWLHHYFVSLDPHALSREFAVLLEAAAQNGFSEHGRLLLHEHLNAWGELLRDEPEIVTAQIRKWREELSSRRGRVSPSAYSGLSKCSPQWPEVQASLESASAHQFTIDHYTQVRDTMTSLSGSVADRLDDLLELLVTEFDDEELPLRREVLYQQAIIKNDGYEDRARAEAELDVAALDETIDALSLQTYTALRPDLLGVSPATQKVAVGACAQDFSTAIGQFTMDYRARWPHALDIQLDNDHSTYAQTYGFGRWATQTTVPQHVAETSLKRQWDEVVQRFIDANTFSAKKIVPHIIAAVVGVIFGMLFITGVPVFGLFVVVLSLGIPGFLAYRKKEACDREVNAAIQAREKAKETSLDIYRAVSAEWVDAKLVYEEEDAKESNLLELIEGWPH